MQPIRSALRKSFFLAAILSFLFVGGIPAIVLGAVNGIGAVMGDRNRRDRRRVLRSARRVGRLRRKTFAVSARERRRRRAYLHRAGTFRTTFPLGKERQRQIDDLFSKAIPYGFQARRRRIETQRKHRSVRNGARRRLPKLRREIFLSGNAFPMSLLWNAFFRKINKTAARYRAAVFYCVTFFRSRRSRSRNNIRDRPRCPKGTLRVRRRCRIRNCSAGKIPSKFADTSF